MGERMEDVPKPFELTPADKQNPLWLNLKKHLEECLQTAREQNDSLVIDVEETNQIRGAIYAYKSLLQLDEDF